MKSHSSTTKRAASSGTRARCPSMKDCATSRPGARPRTRTPAVLRPEAIEQSHEPVGVRAVRWIQLVGDRERPLAHDRPLMRECSKAEFAVIAPESAATDAAEGKIRIGEMDEHVVHE